MPGANKVAVVEGFVVVGEQAERLQGSALGQQYPLYQRGLRWPMIEYQYGDRDQRKVDQRETGQQSSPCR